MKEKRKFNSLFYLCIFQSPEMFRAEAISLNWINSLRFPKGHYIWLKKSRVCFSVSQLIPLSICYWMCVVHNNELVILRLYGLITCGVIKWRLCSFVDYFPVVCQWSLLVLLIILLLCFHTSRWHWRDNGANFGHFRWYNVLWMPNFSMNFFVFFENE